MVKIMVKIRVKITVKIRIKTTPKIKVKIMVKTKRPKKNKNSWQKSKMLSKKKIQNYEKKVDITSLQLIYYAHYLNNLRLFWTTSIGNEIVWAFISWFFSGCLFWVLYNWGVFAYSSLVYAPQFFSRQASHAVSGMHSWRQLLYRLNIDFHTHFYHKNIGSTFLHEIFYTNFFIQNFSLFHTYFLHQNFFTPKFFYTNFFTSILYTNFLRSIFYTNFVSKKCDVNKSKILV